MTNSELQPTDKQKRIHELFGYLKKHKGITQGEFATLVNRSQSYVSKVINGKYEDIYPVELSEDSIDLLVEKVGLNKTWYNTGKGEMLLNADSVNQVAEPASVYRMADIELSPDVPRVAVVSDYVFASFAAIYSDVKRFRDLPHEELPLDLRGRGTIIKMSVYGDSMATSLNHGEYIYAEYVEIRGELDFVNKIRNGHVYVVVPVDSSPMIKRVYYKRGDSFIMCKSDNEDQIQYEPFKITLTDIKSMWYFLRKYGGQLPVPKHLMPK
jgi:phage repressor protein C with HTH and peptisase S24 domain